MKRVTLHRAIVLFIGLLMVLPFQNCGKSASMEFVKGSESTEASQGTPFTPPPVGTADPNALPPATNPPVTQNPPPVNPPVTPPVVPPATPTNALPLAPDQLIGAEVGIVKTIQLQNITASDPDGTIVQFVLIDSLGNIITEDKNMVNSSQIMAKGNNTFEYVTATESTTPFRFRIVDDSGDSTEFTINFESHNAVLDLRPALAVRSMGCVACHASIQGNIVSDFNTSGNTLSLFSRSIPEADNKDTKYLSYAQEYALWTPQAGFRTEWGHHNHGAYTSFGSAFIDGTVFTKKLDLDADTKFWAQSLITEAKTNKAHGFVQAFTGSVLESNTGANVNTLAQYLAAIFKRTSAYVNYLANFPGHSKSISPNTTVSELQGLKISAPSENDIKSIISNWKNISGGNDTKVYIQRPGSSLNLSGLVDKGGYFTNKLTEPLVCDGDLILDKPLLLSRLNIKTVEGCRIYATGSIFLEASTNTPEGIVFVDANLYPKHNLQLSSAKMIGFGYGDCASGNTFSYRASRESSLAGIESQLAANFNQMVRDDGSRLQDAGNCLSSDSSARRISFSRLLANAQRVDSRYTGDYKGVIIANDVLFSLGFFKFIYDPVFDQVTPLPQLKASQFFEAKR